MITPRTKLLVLLLLVLPLPAEATVARALEVEELTLRAEAVVRGTTLESASEWTASGRQIRTVTRIRVAGWLKGGAGAEVVEVRTPGGTVGGITQRVGGAPQLRAGEEVVLFLRRLPGRLPRFAIVGLSQGKFRVLREAGRSLVVRDPGDLRLLGADGRVRLAPRLGPLPLEQLAERIRRALPAPVPGARR